MHISYTSEATDTGEKNVPISYTSSYFNTIVIKRMRAVYRRRCRRRGDRRRSR